MSNYSNFTQTIQNGLNNPDCAFFVGSTVGEWSAIYNLLTLLGIYLIFKLIDKLIFSYIIEGIKNKLKRSKNE